MSIKPVLEIPKIVVFSDINPDVTLDGPFELVYNEDAINKSLETIFSTPKYSRPFRRLFGSNVLNLLFDPIDPLTARMIGQELKDAALTWERRISSVEILVLPDYDNQQYYVEVSYQIPRLGNKMVAYKFNLSRG